MENRLLLNSASPSDVALTRQRSGSKYQRKKPVPVPRTKAPNKTPAQISVKNIHRPIQEQGFATILPHEETTYEPGVEAEEDLEDDSGIGYAADWIGM